MAKYISILTDYGTQALAKALANNQPLRLVQFAVGDGNGEEVTPTANRTALVNEKHRANVSAVSIDPRNNKQIIVELTIPENVGGFFVREMGVFDEQNKLIAYANTPESYKPTLESGSGKIQVLRMVLMVSSSSAVTLSIDNSVIFVTRGQLTPHTITATTANGFDQNGHNHAIDKASTTQAGIVQLTDDTGLDSDKLGLTARAGRKLAQLISALQLALNNYIPLNKRSSAVNSNSNENVATSAAVKTAYDKGVEAKTAADAANTNANGRIPQKVGDYTYRPQTDGNFVVVDGKGTVKYHLLGIVDALTQRLLKTGDTMTGTLTVPHIIVNDPTNNDNSVQIGDEAKFLDIDHGHSVGLQSLSDNTKGYIAYGSSKKKFGFDGYRFFAEGSIFTAQYGYGSFSAQYTSNAPYMVEDTNANQKDTYYPIVKGRFRKQGQYGTAVSFGYTTKQGNGDGFGTGVTINLIEDNGAFKNWLFQHSGDFVSAGDVKSSSGKSLNTAAQLSDFQYQKIGDFEIRRYPDGMMIQTYFTEFNDVHASSLGFGGTGQKQLTWAVSFVGKPMVFGNITTSLNDHHDVGVNILTKSTNTTLYWYNYEHANPNQGLCRLQFLAIGRWK